MLIRHSDSERGYDLYETLEVAPLALLLAEPFPLTIWEPACGHGAIGPRQGSTMSALRLTRAQRRLTQKLADHVDRVTQADRLFFERFPHSQHRVRLASRAEVHQHELIDGKRPPIPPGYRLFAVAPGCPNAVVFSAPEGRETDVCEATARAIYQTVSSPYTWEIEARLRRAAGARP